MAPTHMNRPERQLQTIHEALDHVEEAYKLMQPIDGPTSTDLHSIKQSLHRLVERTAGTISRSQWQNRAREAPNREATT